ALPSFRPDAILCDIGLPGIDGYRLARQLRPDGARQPTLIAITGYGQEEDRRRAQQAGFDHHMTKPVDPALLEKLLVSISRLQGERNEGHGLTGQVGQLTTLS